MFESWDPNDPMQEFGAHPETPWSFTQFKNAPAPKFIEAIPKDDHILLTELFPCTPGCQAVTVHFAHWYYCDFHPFWDMSVSAVIARVNEAGERFGFIQEVKNEAV
jgi:hypothetical protein